MSRLRTLIVVGAFAFLVACAAAPDWRDEDGTWSVTGDIPGGRGELDVTLATIYEMGPNGDIPANWWGGRITFAPIVFGDPGNAGIWAGATFVTRSADFSVATVRHTSPTDPGTPITQIEKTALIHEIGHYLFTRAGLPNANHPPEFYAWVNAVTTEVRARLGR